jgi:RNA 2',3'-cyclic 3'-phosphodiesterase
VKPERARLFVALELPPMVRTALHQWRSEQLQGVAGVRGIEPEALHVTLCFLGSQPAEQIDGIAAACGAVKACPRPVLSLGEPRWLPPRRPRVLAVGLEDRGLALARVQGELADVLRAGGWYEPERRPFLAHVTVARAAGEGPVRPANPPSPVPISFVGTSVALLRSRLSGAGARYERLAAVALGGASSP